MLLDPGLWLFGLAIGLFVAGIVGVVLATRRVPPNEALRMSGVDSMACTSLMSFCSSAAAKCAMP